MSNYEDYTTKSRYYDKTREPVGTEIAIGQLAPRSTPKSDKCDRHGREHRRAGVKAEASYWLITTPTSAHSYPVRGRRRASFLHWVLRAHATACKSNQHK